MSMVDVSKKPEIFREATAKGTIRLKPETVHIVREGRVEKGEVASLAKVAGVLAAKKTSELIPLCHPLRLSSVDVKVEIAMRHMLLQKLRSKLLQRQV